MDDLKHRDWLLFTTKRMIQSVDETISVDIVDTPNGGKLLIASGITEAAIDKLTFLTNTDQNNNYLYLEDLKVYVAGFFTPLNIPGLTETVVNVFRSSDADQFVLGNKLHAPFLGSNYNTPYLTVTSFSDYVDAFSSLTPYAPTTLGRVKTYEITLNPDFVYGYNQNNQTSDTKGTVPK
jgi:hypothetical protein